MHYGPDYGPVSVQSDGFKAQALIFVGGEGVFVSDPEELRMVSAGLVLAADWLEAWQEAPA